MLQQTLHFSARMTVLTIFVLAVSVHVAVSSSTEDYCVDAQNANCHDLNAALLVPNFELGSTREIAIGPGPTRLKFVFSVNEGVLTPKIETSNHECSIIEARLTTNIPIIRSEFTKDQNRSSRVSLELPVKKSNLFRQVNVPNVTDRNTKVAVSEGSSELLVDVHNWSEHDDCLLSVYLTFQANDHMPFDDLVLTTHVKNRMAAMDSASIFRLPYVRVAGFPRSPLTVRDLYSHQLNGCQDFITGRVSSTNRVNLEHETTYIDERLRDFLVALGLSPAIELSKMGALDELLDYDYSGATSLFQEGSAFPFLYSCKAEIADLKKLQEKLTLGETPRIAIYVPTRLPTSDELPEWLQNTTLNFALPAIGLDMLDWLYEHGIRDPREVIFIFRTGNSCQGAEFMVFYDDSGRSLFSAIHTEACGLSSAVTSLPLGNATRVPRRSRLGLALLESSSSASSIDLSELLVGEISNRLTGEAGLEWGFKLPNFAELNVLGAKRLVLKDSEFWEKLGIYAHVIEAGGSSQLLVRVEGFFAPGIGNMPPQDASAYENSMDSQYYKELSEFTDSLAHDLVAKITGK